MICGYHYFRKHPFVGWVFYVCGKFKKICWRLISGGDEIVLRGFFEGEISWRFRDSRFLRVNGTPKLRKGIWVKDLEVHFLDSQTFFVQHLNVQKIKADIDERVGTLRECVH